MADSSTFRHYTKKVYKQFKFKFQFNENYSNQQNYTLVFWNLTHGYIEKKTLTHDYPRSPFFFWFLNMASYNN